MRCRKYGWSANGGKKERIRVIFECSSYLEEDNKIKDEVRIILFYALQEQLKNLIAEGS